MAQRGHSEACCSIPPVVARGYQTKGRYIEIDGMKTYTTGPSSAKDAILIIYDLFGFCDQTLQGADILAHSDQEHQYRVFVPDFFYGKSAEHSWYPPNTKEKGEKLRAFIEGPAAPPKTAEKIPRVVKEIEDKTGGDITTWFGLGMCWGGKVLPWRPGHGLQMLMEVALDHIPHFTVRNTFQSCRSSAPRFDRSKRRKGDCRPDLYASLLDEDPKAVEAFKNELKVKNHVETFHDQVHGWMAARGNLQDPRVREEYERGYKTLLDFYHEYL
ncbi:MAG: hypothetical protein M1830_009454 [Pleopsidium flavum]|nr:MAG: hypothetical protein M1830_009454 [Pleopsidium flavum]